MGNKLIILVLLIFIIHLKGISALGIGPSSETIYFSPELNKTSSFFIYNRGATDNLLVELYAEGDINESITLHNITAEIPPNEQVYFYYDINLPESLEPGPHVVNIGARQLQKEEEKASGINVALAVEMHLTVWVPYPSKYLRLSFSGQDIKVNDKVNFNIQVHNLGKEDLNEVWATIKVYNPKNEEVGSITTNKLSIQSTAAGSLNAEWDSKGNHVGVYSAKAFVYYDEETAEAKTSFKIGDILVEIVNVTGTTVQKGEIAKLGIVSESKWNGLIENVVGEINVYEDDLVVASSRSETTSIKPWEQKTVYSYLDVKDLEIGGYDAEVILYYDDGKKDEMEFTLIVEKKSGNIFSLTNILIIVVVVLIVLVLFLFKRKKKVKKDET